MAIILAIKMGCGPTCPLKSAVSHRMQREICRGIANLNDLNKPPDFRSAYWDRVGFVMSRTMVRTVSWVQGAIRASKRRLRPAIGSV